MPRDGYWPLDDRLTVVIFAGMGGACDGLEAAGFPVHVAINHDEVAVAVHEQRHPHTRHLRADVREVDPLDATGGRPVRILWASPDCRHFSRAKGRAPVSRSVRSLPWVVVRWAGKVRPETIFVENVIELQTWGPLVAKRDPDTGRVLKLDKTVAAPGERVPVLLQQLVPDPNRKGKTWRAWVAHLRHLGYDVEYREQCCANYMIPTIRKRLFVVARRDGQQISWPALTHAPRKKARSMRRKPWLASASIIDWSLPCPSIFGRKKPLAEATLRRIARGVVRYVLQAKEPFLVQAAKPVTQPFIVPITHSGDHRFAPGDEPLRTLTTAHRGELALVAPHVTKFRNGATGSDPRDPLPTVTANSFEKRPGGAIPLGLAAATLVKHNHGSVPHQDVAEPLHAITTQTNKFGVVAGSLVQMGYGERDGQEPRALDLDEPLGTLVAGGCKHGVVAAHLSTMRNADKPFSDPRDPTHTIVADGAKLGLVAAFLAQHSTGNDGHAATEPVSTLTQACVHQQPVAVHLTTLRGTSEAGRSAEEPVPALTAGGTHVGAVAAFLQHYYSQGGQDQDLADPLGAVTTKARSAVVTVTIRGETYALTDIGMRMLSPEECAAAHGFARDALPEWIVINGARRRLTKTERYALVGNSVPPRMAMLLAQCNVQAALVAA